MTAPGVSQTGLPFSLEHLGLLKHSCYLRNNTLRATICDRRGLTFRLLRFLHTAPTIKHLHPTKECWQQWRFYSELRSGRVLSGGGGLGWSGYLHFAPERSCASLRTQLLCTTPSHQAGAPTGGANIGQFPNMIGARQPGR